MASVNGSSNQDASPNIETIPTPNSSFLEAIEYDSVNYRLTVHFKNGAIHQHPMFFPIMWSTFKIAPSHGSHYANNIKGKFASIQIRPAHTKKPSKLNKENKNGK